MNAYEQHKIKRDRKEEEKLRKQQKKKIIQLALWGVGIIAVVGVAALIALNTPNESLEPQSEIVSRNGLHWHPEIEIYVQGEKQQIPANIGMGVGGHNPIHTHDSTGEIHLEFRGLVRQDDIRLGRFFDVWGKGFTKFGSSVDMTVNGIESAELADYLMQDNDKIELRYR
jgi:hypothetical protein